MHGVRYVGVHDLELGIRKETTIKEKYSFTIAANMINALNSAQFFGDAQTSFTNGNFGMVGEPNNAPSNDPRVIEIYVSFQF
jgi:argininosuccinate synthase